MSEAIFESAAGDTSYNPDIHTPEYYIQAIKEGLSLDPVAKASARARRRNLGETVWCQSASAEAGSLVAR